MALANTHTLTATMQAPLKNTKLTLCGPVVWGQGLRQQHGSSRRVGVSGWGGWGVGPGDRFCSLFYPQLFPEPESPCLKLTSPNNAKDSFSEWMREFQCRFLKSTI